MAASSSPLHVHVDEETPVHVHVKKCPDLLGQSKSGKMRGQRSRSSSAGKRSPTRTSLKSPRAPWVPAPAKTSRGSKVTFEGSRGTLEIGGPYYDAMRRSELDRGRDEDRDDDTVAVTAQSRDYERKISGLMKEVGGLRDQAEEGREVAEILNKSVEELRETRKDLWEKERENRRLRESVDDLKQSVDATKNSARSLSADRNRLLKKLIEAEMDGQEAVRQAGQLKDVVKRLRSDNKMTSQDVKMLSIQRENMTEKLADFEETNRALRMLLQDQHANETEQLRLTEQKSILVNKFAACEEDNDRLRQQAKDLEREVVDLKIQLRTQTDETMASATLQSSLEQTRAHLQRELRQREGDCNRMAVQIRSLESELAQERIEVDHLQELLRQAHSKHEKDKEALKKATRIQKQRATKSESVVDELNLANMEKDQKLAELQALHDEQRALLNSSAREKAAISSENSSLKTVNMQEERHGADEDEIVHSLHIDLSYSDYRHTVSELREEVERLARVNYAKEFRIHRLQSQLKKSCGLMESLLRKHTQLLQTSSVSTTVAEPNKTSTGAVTPASADKHMNRKESKSESCLLSPVDDLPKGSLPLSSPSYFQAELTSSEPSKSVSSPLQDSLSESGDGNREKTNQIEVPLKCAITRKRHKTMPKSLSRSVTDSCYSKSEKSSKKEQTKVMKSKPTSNVVPSVGTKIGGSVKKATIKSVPAFSTVTKKSSKLSQRKGKNVLSHGSSSSGKRAPKGRRNDMSIKSAQSYCEDPYIAPPSLQIKTFQMSSVAFGKNLKCFSIDKLSAELRLAKSGSCGMGDGVSYLNEKSYGIDMFKHIRTHVNTFTSASPLQVMAVSHMAAQSHHGNKTSQSDPNSDSISSSLDPVNPPDAGTNLVSQNMQMIIPRNHRVTVSSSLSRSQWTDAIQPLVSRHITHQYIGEDSNNALSAANTTTSTAPPSTPSTMLTSPGQIQSDQSLQSVSTAATTPAASCASLKAPVTISIKVGQPAVLLSTRNDQHRRSESDNHQAYPSISQSSSQRDTKLDDKQLPAQGQLRSDEPLLDALNTEHCFNSKVSISLQRRWSPVSNTVMSPSAETGSSLAQLKGGLSGQLPNVGSKAVEELADTSTGPLIQGRYTLYSDISDRKPVNRSVCFNNASFDDGKSRLRVQSPKTFCRHCCSENRKVVDRISHAEESDLNAKSDVIVRKCVSSADKATEKHEMSVVDCERHYMSDLGIMGSATSLAGIIEVGCERSDFNVKGSSWMEKEKHKNCEAEKLHLLNTNQNNSIDMSQHVVSAPLTSNFCMTQGTSPAQCDGQLAEQDPAFVCLPHPSNATADGFRAGKVLRGKAKARRTVNCDITPQCTGQISHRSVNSMKPGNEGQRSRREIPEQSRMSRRTVNQVQSNQLHVESETGASRHRGRSTHENPSRHGNKSVTRQSRTSKIPSNYSHAESKSNYGKLPTESVAPSTGRVQVGTPSQSRIMKPSSMMSKNKMTSHSRVSPPKYSRTSKLYSNSANKQLLEKLATIQSASVTAPPSERVSSQNVVNQSSHVVRNASSLQTPSRGAYSVSAVSSALPSALPSKYNSGQSLSAIDTAGEDSRVDAVESSRQSSRSISKHKKRLLNRLSGKTTSRHPHTVDRLSTIYSVGGSTAETANNSQSFKQSVVNTQSSHKSQHSLHRQKSSRQPIMKQPVSNPNLQFSDQEQRAPVESRLYQQHASSNQIPSIVRSKADACSSSCSEISETDLSESLVAVLSESESDTSIEDDDEMDVLLLERNCGEGPCDPITRRDFTDGKVIINPMVSDSESVSESITRQCCQLVQVASKIRALSKTINDNDEMIEECEPLLDDYLQEFIERKCLLQITMRTHGIHIRDLAPVEIWPQLCYYARCEWDKRRPQCGEKLCIGDQYCVKGGSQKSSQRKEPGGYGNGRQSSRSHDEVCATIDRCDVNCIHPCAQVIGDVNRCRQGEMKYSYDGHQRDVQCIPAGQHDSQFVPGQCIESQRPVELSARRVKGGEMCCCKVSACNRQMCHLCIHVPPTSNKSEKSAALSQVRTCKEFPASFTVSPSVTVSPNQQLVFTPSIHCNRAAPPPAHTLEAINTPYVINYSIEPTTSKCVSCTQCTVEEPRTSQSEEGNVVTCCCYVNPSESEAYADYLCQRNRAINRS